MSLRLAILGLLNEGTKSGYDLVKEFSYDRSVIWPAPKNEIYRELAKLLEQDLIREDQVGPRERRSYAITPAGKKQLKRWLADDSADFTLRYEPILRAVFMTAIQPEKIRARLLRDLPFYEQQLQILVAAESRQSALEPKLDPRRYGRRQALALYRALRDWTRAALDESQSARPSSAKSKTVRVPIK